MGCCESLCHRYSTVTIKTTRTITHPDRRVERIYSVTHKKEVGINDDLDVEDLEQ